MLRGNHDRGNGKLYVGLVDVHLTSGRKERTSEFIADAATGFQRAQRAAFKSPPPRQLFPALSGDG